MDVSGDVLASVDEFGDADYEVHIRRFDGTSFQEEATFTIPEDGGGVAATNVMALPDMVLVKVGDCQRWNTGWRAFTYLDGEWHRASCVFVPEDDQVDYRWTPVAAGDRIAAGGDGVIYVYDLVLEDLRGEG